ncbi:MAG: hypothetical protein ACREON_17290 [Gemmatimonadaceae bacterium]
MALLCVACGDATRPPAFDAPAFVFVSEVGGVSQLFRFRNDSIVPLVAGGGDDFGPKSASGRIVFTSRRDGNAELYLTGVDGTAPRRLTNHAADDGEGAPDSRAERVAFVSARSGAPRIWLMDTTGANLAALATGSAAFVAEHAPAWSPQGDRIAFTSLRTGTSQVFVVPAAGGDAEQVTHESAGAFSPSWSADGSSIRYVTGAAEPRLRAVVLASGAVADFATDRGGLGDLSCSSEVCLAVSAPLGPDRDIVAIVPGSRAPIPVLARVESDRQPAVIEDGGPE